MRSMHVIHNLARSQLLGTVRKVNGLLVHATDVKPPFFRALCRQSAGAIKLARHSYLNDQPSTYPPCGWRELALVASTLREPPQPQWRSPRLRRKFWQIVSSECEIGGLKTQSNSTTQLSLHKCLPCRLPASITRLLKLSGCACLVPTSRLQQLLSQPHYRDPGALCA